MAKRNSTTRSSKQKAERAIKEAAANPWVDRLARCGFISKGVIYSIVGALATLAAFSAGGKTTDSRGVFQEILNKPFGQVMLAAVSIGLVGYVIWRFVEAILDASNKGSETKGILIRFGYAVSGTIHAGLAFTAAKMVLDARDNGGEDPVRYWTSQLMSLPFGAWLVALAGAGTIIFGLYQIYKGIKTKYFKKLAQGEMSETAKSWAKRSGQIGLSARGIVFIIIGVFLVQAGFNYNPAEAQGLDGALRTLAEQPFGPWVLGVVAIGLIAYGMYMFVMAFYAKLLRYQS